MCNCYLRGWSWLGLFNTVIGCIFWKVLVKVIYEVPGKRIVSWYFDDASKYPKEGGLEL